jgi:hypothetical protein
VGQAQTVRFGVGFSCEETEVGDIAVRVELGEDVLVKGMGGLKRVDMFVFDSVAKDALAVDAGYSRGVWYGNGA